MRERDLAPLMSKEPTELERQGTILCRQASTEGSVLLENNGALPMRPQPVALFGYGARHTIVRGIGSGDISYRYRVSVEEGLKNAGFRIATNSWLDAFDALYETELEKLNQELQVEAAETGIDCIHILYEKPHILQSCQEITQRDISSAGTDTAIYVLTRKEGEGRDNRFVEGEYLPAKWELTHLRELRDEFSTLVLLLNIASPIDMKAILEIGPDAILLMFQGGAEIGNAVADMLTGACSPSGKLTNTWAKDYWDYPNSATFGANGGDPVDKQYEEGIYVGYRYFDSFDVTPQYPFGYGLSYTDFAIQVTDFELEGSECTVAVDVKNTGNHPGKEVVQLYMSQPQGLLDKPFQQLCAYDKTALLHPGEQEKILLRFKMEEQVSFSTAQGAYLLEAGDYIVRAGNSSRNTHVCGIVRLKDGRIVRRVRNLFERSVLFEELSSKDVRRWSYPGESAEIEAALVLWLETEAIPQRPPAAYSGTPPNYLGGAVTPQEVNLGDGQCVQVEVPEDITLDRVKRGECTLEQMLAALNEVELCHVVVGQEYVNPKYLLHHVSTHVMGAVGETTNYFIGDSKGIPYTVTSDGPAGLRLVTRFQTGPDGKIMMIDPVLNYEDGRFGIDEYVDDDERYTDYYQYVTALPISIQIASTWNRDLITRLGDIIGGEMERYDIDLWLAPGLNIHRNPLCGRNFEYFSEDPVISAATSVALIDGVQSHPGRGATIKHMVANNQETLRTAHNSIVSERAMREIYLRGFELIIRRCEPYAVMTSLNCINGLHGANNPDIGLHVVKDEWQYKGMVMTDWNTTTPERGGSTVGCVNAGNDLIMPGSTADIERLLQALRNKTGQGDFITLGALQRSAAHVLRYIMKTERV